MAKIYETGNKNYVIRMACRYSIDGLESEADERMLKFFADADQQCIDLRKTLAEIRDFKKLIERSYP